MQASRDETDYEDGGYRKWVNVDSNLFGVIAGQSFADAREVNATK